MTATNAERFAAALSQTAEAIEKTLDACLPPPVDIPGEGPLIAAMRYAVMGGGKRLRAFLAVEAGRITGAPRHGTLRAGAALECLHAYSLVHDDLPAMDDDDLRRGKPTVHRAWDEATAILAGDALQTEAFRILANEETHGDALVRARCVLRLAEASGAAGMVGGQALDLAAEAGHAHQDAAAVKRLQAMKTGALLQASAEIGALLGQAARAHLEAISTYAAALGEAFQIADDLLDVEGDEAEVGKRVGKDAGAGKATFVDILGLEGAKARARQLADEAAAALAPFGEDAALLSAAAYFVVDRKS
ncbi:MAG: polyprenyl synthetase family protein [Pseudomonadota bacterium]